MISCALVPVIEGAGGMITDWEGRALGLDSGDKVLAAGDPRMHAQALKLLAAQLGPPLAIIPYRHSLRRRE